ncbi:tRNA dihydrouridine(20/20a) synthase DusA [Alphaproteobacteria bacterium]|nr:tRNA dihydrouridine(20/20a) synthase DusA [Alphaproteobacteria bacterium]
MNKNKLTRSFCIAPMMGYTTPHARKLYRILSKKSFLFTEMIPTKTMLYSKSKDLIIENDMQNPIALQVGGSEIEDLIKCTRIAKTYNYDEINLNVGCPSKAVQKGSFGACLMKEKNVVRDCLDAMNNVDGIEVSIKCRIGLGKNFNYDFFSDFVNTITQSGIKIIYVHARNALLSGISPKANRSVPPLNYDFVKKIKKEFPQIQFILNGGIESIRKAHKLSKEHDGVMLGRLIQNNPFCLSQVDKLFYNYEKYTNINENIILDYFNYIKPRIENDSIFRLLSPLLQIFFGIPDSKKFKIEIHNKIKNKKIDELEFLFLKFVNQQNELTY